MLIDWLPLALQRLCRSSRQSSTQRRQPRQAFLMGASEKLEERALLSSVTGDIYGPVETAPIITETSVDPAIQSLAETGTASNGMDAFLARDSAGRIGVRVTSSNVTGILAQLQGQGFGFSNIRTDLNFVDGYIAPEAAAGLAQINGVLGVMPIYRPLTNAGNVTSQADSVLEADRVRATFPPGYDGSGVTIGIISDSFNSGGSNPINGVMTGDLPNNIRIVSEGPFGSTNEGRAMGELIHDLAPGAAISFATGLGGEAAFAQAILDLANPALGNADIIVDDFTYMTEPMFQDGVIAQAINQVVNNQGVVYFAAAGNAGNNSFETTNISFQPDSSTAQPLPGNWLDFDIGTGALRIDVRNSVFLQAGQSLTLSMQWDDPFYTANGVDTDLDLFIVDSLTGQILASSTSNNIATQTPYEIVSYTLPENSFFSRSVDIMVRLDAGPSPGRIKWIDFGDGVDTEYEDISGNKSTLFGHAAAASAISIAAAPYFDSNNPSADSALGGTPILFTPTGSPLGFPTIRSTPTLTSIDGTNTTFFTGGIFETGVDIEKDGLPNFFGTSAAAAHAAAVAALLKQANPGMSPSQIRQHLINTADDIGDTGFDFKSGNGLINAYRAVMGLPVNATANFQESNESGVLSGVWEINTFGSGSVKQSTAFGGSLGSTSMVMRSSLDGADYFSMIDYLRDDFFQVEQDFFKDTAKGQMGALSEAILHLDLSGQTEDVFLSFSAKQTVNISNLTSSFSNDMQEPMSQVFTGHEAADGVALSVDGGITWYRIRSLVDEYIGQNFVSSKVNLSQLANQYGLQLGSNVQIKFQQFDSLGSTDSSGDFTFFNPERKTVSPVGTSHIQTNAIILDNIQVFTNQGPSLTLTAGQTPYRSGAPAVIIDAGASVEDPETPNFDGAVLTVSIVANGTGSDRVEILPQTGVGTGLITLQSNRVLHGGAEIGTFTGGTLGQPLRITFNLNTSPTVVQKVIRQIAFRTTSTSLLDRSVQFQLTDGQGGTSATAIKVIDMQVGGNTAPVITLSPESLMISRAAAPVPIEAGAIVEDSDSANFDGGKLTIKITTNANSSDRIEVRHQGNGAGQIGVSGSIIKYQGVQIGTLSGSTSSRIISLNANATVAAVQALMQNITFRTISSTAPVSTRTVQFQLTDGDGGTSAVANKAVNVVTKNTAPVLTVGSTIPVFRVTPGTAILIDSAATVTDADSTNFAGGQLTVRISAAATTNDRLTIRNQGPSTGQITVSGSNVLYGGIIIGTYSGGTGTAALVVNFNQNATAAATRALVRNITFSTTGSSTATTQRRTLTLQLTDGDGGTSKAVTKRIDVKLK